MAIFENPNQPQQPQPGVYVWNARKDGKETAIYVGEAGKRRSLLPTGTLFRGVSELQRCPLTSNSSTDRYSTLDTNFIVGTAIRYFEKLGYICAWKHISDDPEEETLHVQQLNPILQKVSTADIKEGFKLKNAEVQYWRARQTQAGIKEAENGIFSALDGATRTR